MHVLNVGNVDAISIKDGVTLCYKCLDKTLAFVNVNEDIEQRNYFSFYKYEYYLDVEEQQKIYANAIDIEEGLRESAKWYLENGQDFSAKMIEMAQEKMPNAHLYQGDFKIKKELVSKYEIIISHWGRVILVI